MPHFRGAHLRNSPRTIPVLDRINSDGCQRGSATASPVLRAIEPLSFWSVMFVAAASPQRAGWYTLLDCLPKSCRTLYHILGIADAAKEHIRHLLAAESCGAPGVTLVKPFASPRSFSPRWVKNADAPIFAIRPIFGLQETA